MARERHVTSSPDETTHPVGDRSGRSLAQLPRCSTSEGHCRQPACLAQPMSADGRITPHADPFFCNRRR